MHKISVLFLVSVVTISFLQAQSKHSIPVHSAYLLPASNKDEVVNERNTSTYQWTDTAKKIHFYFHHSTPGVLTLSLQSVAFKVAQQIKVSAGGKQFSIQIPVGTKTKEIRIGTIPVMGSGFMEVILSAKKLVRDGIKVESLIISGNATEGIRYNAKPRKNAASVHLRYPLADSIRAIGFYNEVTVPKGYDHLHSFYMANGFSRGYFGIQVNGEKERRVIFSVWDAGNEAIDRNKVADADKVKLLAKGDGVITNDFGNEGTGGHSH